MISPSPVFQTPLIALDDPVARDPARAGNKAARLAELRAAGFEVPDGVVLAPEASPTQAELNACLEQLGGAVAVRSSGCGEDGQDASWAGQFESRLEICDLVALGEAIELCRASANTPRALAYARQQGVNIASLPLLIQRMVPARRAGVAFSADPISGELQRARVSAVTGLAEGLVSGERVAEEWTVLGDRPERQAGPEVVADESLVKRVAELARRVAEYYGSPQDIEWAEADGTVHLLQARPIVDFPLRPEFEVPAGTWTKDLSHFPEPVTPLGATAYMVVVEPAFAKMTREWGLMPDDMQYRSIGYEAYSRMLPEGGKPPPWWVLGLVARVIPPLRRKLARAAEMVASGQLRQVAESWEQHTRADYAQRIATFRNLDLQAMSDAQLADQLSQLLDFFAETGIEHMRLFIPYLVGIYDLHNACAQLEGWNDGQTMRLLQGLSAASSAPSRELLQIAEVLASSPAAVAVVREVRPDFVEALEQVDATAAAAVRGWLRDWGLRPVGYDPGRQSLAEQPALVAELLSDLLDQPAAPELERERQAFISATRARFADDAARARFDEALVFAEFVYPIREDNIHYTDSLPNGLIRRAALAIGERLVQQGRLARATEAAYLEVAELLGAHLNSNDLRALVLKRRAEMAWVRAHPGPNLYGPPASPPPSLRGLPAPARRLNGAILWAMEAEMRPPPEPAADGSVSGIGASAGRYRGRVRVILDAAELHLLERGEVLVCPITTPSWSVYFSRVGALVTDGGSVLSHAAIIAREHGVPAVVATGSATRTLETGMRVEVDGSAGEVQVLTGA